MGGASGCPGRRRFLPYSSPAGEGAPFLDPLARDVLEGLTLVIRDCPTASGDSPTELRVCGGGAASALWLQLIADVTGILMRSAVRTAV